MQRTKWTERKFKFDFPEGWIFNILERLHGTAARIRHMTVGADPEILSFRPEGKWSIKEHVGHLIDLEELHDGRIDDFLARKETLRAADMSNKKTEEANHNDRLLKDLIDEFANHRDAFIKRIRQLDDETQHFRSLHPRLQVPMRPVDMVFFTAEHDDHHLASIRMILSSNDFLIKG